MRPLRDRRRVGLGSTTATAVLAWPSTAAAHGVQGRAETPIPISAFFWVAAIVMVVSFVGLAFGWSRSRLQTVPWRPVPARFERVARDPRLLWTVRIVVLVLFLLVLAAAAFGSTRLNSNLAPVAIFVVWWVGLVPVVVLLGDVWSQVNPWRTIATLAGWHRRQGRPLPAWMGWWPAALLLVLWAWIELVYPTSARPRLIAAWVVAYSAVNLAGMWRYGVARWTTSGDLFSVYSRVLASLSIWETREIDGRDRLGLRPPVVGVVSLPERPGQVMFVGALVATVSFDGLSGSTFWAERDVTAAERLIDLGIGSFTAGIIVATIGLLTTLAIVIGGYRAAAWSAARLGRFPEPYQAARALAHTLVPIALAYFVAHYFTLFAFAGQDIVRLLSDPFGSGWNLWGTADFRIDFQLVSPNLIWGVQVTAIIVGHVLGLALAHDRALQLSPSHRAAVLSQAPMLVLMVALTVAGLWSLSEGMANV
ncbi:MAG: hypothetical protein AB7G37_01635 [Solirubrobacteraceae bacterium]